jgi:cellulose biosynthesis protein BcsQ
MRILILDVHAQAREMLSARIEEALRQAGVRRVELLESEPDALASLVAEEPPQLCFLGPGCYGQLEECLNQYLMVYPKVPVAVVLNNDVYAAEGVELRRTLRIRVMPIADIGQMAQFVLDCDTPSSSSGSQKNRGVITVLQFKGGVGGTTVASALAGCWARNGVRTALLDLDDVNAQITDWARVGASQRRLVSESVRSGVVPKYKVGELGYAVEGYNGCLMVYGQPEHYGEGFHFKADVLDGVPSIAGYVQSLIEALQESVDVVVIDSGSSWGISTFAALPLSQRVLAVVDDDRSSLRRTIDNFSRIYRESDDPSEFDLNKWNFLLNAFTDRVLHSEEVMQEIEALDLFPERVELFTLPYSEKAREWSLSPVSFYDLAEPQIRSTLAEIAFGLVPFQIVTPVIPLYDRLRQNLRRIVS